MPAERLSVLFGDNGQGKTNVLEAAYYLAALRSFRTTHADDLIQRGAPHGRAHLRAEVLHRGLERRFDVELGPAGRVVRLDGKLVRSTAAALGAVSVVLFVPEDLLLPRAAPAARRRFLDLAIFNVERGYYAEASAFQKVLRNRNALLKRRDWDRTLLDAFDDELARTGARVVMRRRALAGALAPRLAEHFRALHGDLPVSLVYRSEADGGGGHRRGRCRARRWHGGWSSGGPSTSGAASPGLVRRPTTSRSGSRARSPEPTPRRASSGRSCWRSSWLS